MSSDIQKASTALAILVECCTTALSALQHTKPPSQAPPLSSLRQDFISLLSLIYSNTTKLSIALNPTSSTPSAALRPLKDLTAESSTLVSNACTFDPAVHGQTLTEEIHAITSEVLVTLRKLSTSLLDLLTSPSESNKNVAGNQYLVYTGELHDIIQIAKSDPTKGLSTDNVAAVRKRWKMHGEIIADAVAELREYVSAESDEEDKDVLDELDGVVFGLDASKQSSAQQAFAEELLEILNDTSSIYDQVSTSLFPASSSLLPVPPSATVFDALLPVAATLADRIDELICRVYTGSRATFSEACDQYVIAVDAVALAVDKSWGDSKTRKQDEFRGEEKRDRSWFREQFKNINDKAKCLEWPQSSAEAE